jgi:LCP family protein required for cell wall assembly
VSERPDGSDASPHGEPSHGLTFGPALALAALAALLPGIAHLYLRRRAGKLIILTAGAVLVVAVIVARSAGWTGLVRLAVEPGWLVALLVGALLLAAAWCAVVLWSFAIGKPAELSTSQRVAATTVLFTVCLAIAAPLGLVSRAAYLQRQLLLDVFPPAAAPTLTATPTPTATKTREPDPWAGRPRVNILLLGSDAAPGRPGLRTDSVVLASIDTRTGSAVLFGLPRNLQRVPFPAGSRADRRFPSGFPGLLNEVYKYGVEHPDVMPGARRPGVALVAAASSAALGVRVDHYLLADLRGFKRIVNALGGVTIRVERRLPIGGITRSGSYVSPDGWIEPGVRKLKGDDALWYVRSRRGSHDYDRMARARCLLGALVRQVDPKRVLVVYDDVVAAAKANIMTDLPRNRLRALVKLLPKTRHAGVSSVLFVPPAIRTARPNWSYIHARARNALVPTRPGVPAPGARSLSQVCRYS